MCSDRRFLPSWHPVVCEVALPFSVQDEVLIAGFRRKGHAVCDTPGVQFKILKHEWPARWSSFIPDLVVAASEEY